MPVALLAIVRLSSIPLNLVDANINHPVAYDDNDDDNIDYNVDDDDVDNQPVNLGSVHLQTIRDSLLMGSHTPGLLNHD